MAGATRFLTGLVLQAAADAFAIAALPTNLNGLVDRAYHILQITLAVPALTAGANMDIQIALARRVQAAMIDMTDPECLFFWNRSVKTVTAVGSFIQDTLIEIPVPQQEENQMLIVEDPIYLLIDSAATGLANTAQVRIAYVEKKINISDRLALIENSIS